ncbi:hypothetical protein GH153_06615 [bacterium]|nr:hypothetical protein [bacterium]
MKVKFEVYPLDNPLLMGDPISIGYDPFAIPKVKNLDLTLSLSHLFLC